MGQMNRMGLNCRDRDRVWLTDRFGPSSRTPQNRDYSCSKERNFSRSRSSKTRFLSTTLETQW